MRVNGGDGDGDTDTVLEGTRGGLLAGLDKMDEKVGANAKEHGEAGEEKAPGHDEGISSPAGEEEWSERTGLGQKEGGAVGI